MSERPEGEGWQSFQFFGGPKDGEITWVRGAPVPGGRRGIPHPPAFIRFLDPIDDPAHGVKPGQRLHIYYLRGGDYMYGGEQA